MLYQYLFQMGVALMLVAFNSGKIRDSSDEAELYGEVQPEVLVQAPGTGRRYGETSKKGMQASFANLSIVLYFWCIYRFKTKIETTSRNPWPRGRFYDMRNKELVLMVTTSKKEERTISSRL
ncbi:hypothetical protein RRG08_055254 [Elysia crispata]|uniref:Uncharacterized protein n=1 Tax=Elysia crispata TaxID=231223 RepID=A0AAE0XVW2_9GAST|nr:hypothetical protein RRG08_055254 [Elysia crispata]